MSAVVTFILISFVKSQNENCSDIIPTKSSDCKLSEEEKSLYKYCCMEQFDDIKTCYHYDQDTYNLQKNTYERDKEKLGKDYIFECNSSSIKFAFIYFLLLCFYTI